MQAGRFAPVNRITTTAFLWPGLPHQDRQPTIASLLKAHTGYDVVWKGKWHLAFASNAAPGNGGEDWGPADIKAMEKNWGWSGWNPPDAGNAIQEMQGTQFGFFNGLHTLGGGYPNNDGRYVHGYTNSPPGQIEGVGGESAIAFLKSRAKGSSKPFCLFVSLVNPHDIGAYPGNRSRRPRGNRSATGVRTSPISASSCRPTMTMTCRPSRASKRWRATIRQIRFARRSGCARGIRQLLCLSPYGRR